jgi:integrase
MGFDRVLERAEALLTAKPLRQALSDAEVKRMTEYYYSQVLREDDIHREQGLAILIDDEQEIAERFQLGAHSAEDIAVGEILDLAEDALARGDLTHVRQEVADLLEVFGIRLNESSDDYRRLSLAVLREHVKAYRALRLRSRGDPIATPASVGASTAAGSWEPGGSLREALEGWKKERTRPDTTVHEYGRAVDMFIDLHGNLSVSAIKRSHARTFRDALREVPKQRRGPLRGASLTQLTEWGRKHPDEPKVSAGSVNKQLGAVQAVAGWGFHHGLVPDDVPWSDPFKEMRLDEEPSTRAPFDTSELQAIFDAPLFTEGKIPEGGKGAAAIWLPLLALYSGARQGELAGLRASDVQAEQTSGTPIIVIAPDKRVGRRIKNKSSERAVPVHSKLVELGFLDYVAKRRHDDEKAWLFPAVAPDQKGALRAWSKWWGRYLRDHAGIGDTDKVFHSYRHAFKDGARMAGMSMEVHDALTGHANASVGGDYGAKNMLARFGIRLLKQAMDSIAYPGLDLSRVRTSISAAKRARLTS